MNDLHVFSLTPLTRNAAAGRRVIIQGFDVPWRTFVVAVGAFIPALLVTALAWAFIGQLALAAIAIVEGAAFLLIEGRSRKGLHLRTYQTLLDKRNADTGLFFMCGRQFDPAVNAAVTLRANTVPLDRPVAPAHDLVDAILTGGRFSEPPARELPEPRALTARPGRRQLTAGRTKPDPASVPEPKVPAWAPAAAEVVGDPIADLASRLRLPDFQEPAR